jgi:hypothetical protein
MRNPEDVYQFSKGQWSPLLNPPEWLLDAMLADRENEDRDRALSDQGAENVEHYGELNETVDVWRRSGSGWLVDWWDTDSHVMSILIDNAADFAMFQAAWICPMATKIMAADAYIRGNVEREAAAQQETAAIH